MCNYTETIISPNDLVNQTIYKMDMKVERSSEVILTGTIYNEKQVPIQGAVIEVIAIYYTNHRVKKGYVITNQEGDFAIVVEKKEYINYQLNIYEPLVND